MLKFIIHTISITDENKRSVLAKWAGIETYMDINDKPYPVSYYCPDSLCIEIEIDGSDDQAFQNILDEQYVSVKVSLLKNDLIMQGESAALNANLSRTDSKGAIFNLTNIMRYLNLSIDVFADIRKAISESLISMYDTSEISLIRARGIIDFESPFRDKALYENLSNELYLIPWVCKNYERGFRGIRIECDLGMLRIKPIDAFEKAFSIKPGHARHEWYPLSQTYFLAASEPGGSLGTGTATGTVTLGQHNRQMSCGSIIASGSGNFARGYNDPYQSIHYNPGELQNLQNLQNMRNVIAGDPGYPGAAEISRIANLLNNDGG